MVLHTDYHLTWYGTYGQEHVTGGFWQAGNAEPSSSVSGLFYWCPHHQSNDLSNYFETSNKGSRHC